MAGDVLTGRLGRALAAFEQRKEEESLRLLLEVWQESRSERIAALVEKLSDRLTAELPPLGFEPFPAALDLHRPISLPRGLAGLMGTASRGLADRLISQFLADARDVGLCATSPLARRLERFTASVPGAWTLEATPSAEVTVSATLLTEQRCGELARVIRAAVGFGAWVGYIPRGMWPAARTRASCVPRP
jgi:hypothetical protein